MYHERDNKEISVKVEMNPAQKRSIRAHPEG